MATRFGILISLLASMASGAGLAWPVVYAHETRSWAAQATGQDAVTLVVAVPLLAIASTVWRHSWGAWFVWLGVVAYLAYSFVLYAFFVHFGPLFPVYVAVLGLAGFGLFTTLVATPRHTLASVVSGMPVDRPAVAVLLIQAAFFGTAWLADISGAIAHGSVPTGVVEIGAPVNPVHVLDLAFALPAMVTTAVLFERGHLYGRVLTVPLLVFAALMGTAIVGMTIAMAIRGVAASGGVAVVIAVFAIADAACAVRLLRCISAGGEPGRS